MKKILLFICLVMMAVGAKAADYTLTEYYSYLNSASWDDYDYKIVRFYDILQNASYTEDQMKAGYIGDIQLTSVKVDGTECISSLGTISKKPYINRYSGTYGVDIYFHDISKSYVSIPTSSTDFNTFKNATSSDNTSSNGYKYGFNVGICRNKERTYVVEGYVCYGSTTTRRTFTLTIKPDPDYTNALYFTSNNWTAITGEDLSITTYSSVKVERNYSTGGSNSSSVTLSKTSYAGPSNYDSFTATCTKPGTYTVTISQRGYTPYFPSSATRTITVRNPNDLTPKNTTIALTDGTASIALSSLYTTSSTGKVTPVIKSASSIYGKTLQEDSDYGFNNKTFYAKEAGTYVINLSQDQTDYYYGTSEPKTVTVTVTGGTRPYYLKTMSCVMNEIDLTPLGNAKVDVTIDGNTTSHCALDANWAANSRNLRYVKSKTTYANLPQTYLDNQIVLKTTDDAAVTSDKIVIGGSGKIVSNPVMSDREKFDYVIPDNAALQSASDRTISFSRSEGIPAAKHYATICLPFSVPESYMPAGYTFEEHVPDAKPQSTTSPTRFTFAFQQVTSLEAGKPYIFTRNADASVPLQISVPATACKFVTEPSYDDKYFYGTFVNLIEKDLHAETATNPYYNGDASVSSGELTTFFNKIYDSENTRVAYFLKQIGNEDLIRRAGTNVTMRPLRAYFRFKGTDLPAPSNAKLMILHLDLDDDDSTTGIKSSRADDSGFVDVYTLSGIRVAKHREVSKALEGLKAGTYILSNGKKVSK